MLGDVYIVTKNTFMDPTYTYVLCFFLSGIFVNYIFSANCAELGKHDFNKISEVPKIVIMSQMADND